MKNRRLIILPVLIIIAAVFIMWDIVSQRDSIDAFSGATPLALERQVSADLSLTIDGMVKQTYHFNGHSFARMAKTRIRTREVNPRGEIMGAYIYTGIPVLYILEGVVPEKSPNPAFDRPLDMIVVFTSASGDTVRFSYGELTITGDSLPVTLAYHREPLLPSKNPDAYTGNKYPGNITGLHLICPRETDTSRYLDNVVRLSLELPSTPDHLLPRMQKGEKCTASAIVCIEGETQQPAGYEDVPRIEVNDWFRIGHGRGIKGNRLASASGYRLDAFLEKNFPGAKADDFFLFVACDGYRVLLSGREIFCTAAGQSYMLIDLMNGQPPKSGKTLGIIPDFFVDRSVWGVSHILHLPASKKTS